MMHYGSRRFPGLRIESFDLARPSFARKFDVMLMTGKLSAQFFSDADFAAVLETSARLLNPGGTIYFDSYDSSKIDHSSYFGGEVSCGADGAVIKRTSTMRSLSQTPQVVECVAQYSGTIDSRAFEFTETFNHRIFSKEEIRPILNASGFDIVSQGDSFDENSFFTLAALRSDRKRFLNLA